MRPSNQSKRLAYGLFIAALAVILLTCITRGAMAQEGAETAAAAEPSGLNSSLGATSQALDTMWILVTAFLVMWMQAGFALVETGLTRARTP